MTVSHAVGDVPDGPGAYAIAIALRHPLIIRLPRRDRDVLRPGRYVYCGSAYGPGGLRARVHRHLRKKKPVRWHVDRLTAAGDITAVIGVPGGNECALFAAVLAVPGSSTPVPGFGSSDCRRCKAHLAAVPDTFDLDSLGV